MSKHCVSMKRIPHIRTSVKHKMLTRHVDSIADGKSVFRTLQAYFILRVCTLCPGGRMSQGLDEAASGGFAACGISTAPSSLTADPTISARSPSPAPGCDRCALLPSTGRPNPQEIRRCLDVRLWDWLSAVMLPSANRHPPRCAACARAGRQPRSPSVMLSRTVRPRRFPSATTCGMPIVSLSGRGALPAALACSATVASFRSFSLPATACESPP